MGGMRSKPRKKRPEQAGREKYFGRRAALYAGAGGGIQEGYAEGGGRGRASIGRISIRLPAKLHEELRELEAARVEGGQDNVEGEVGDLLFVVMEAMARFLKSGSGAGFLRKTNMKFRRRFGYIEDVLAKRRGAP